MMIRSPVESHTNGKTVRLMARVPLPTTFGVFDTYAFECPNGMVYLALVRGEIDGVAEVLTRVHSECVTGDTLGSLRCDCGTQLRLALHSVSAAGQGVVVYATGHEGRGIGLVNKLRSYVEQDLGADTVDANVRLGLPIDARDYGPTADVLRMLGIRSVRLLTNNPGKVAGLRSAGIAVSGTVPIPSAPHTRNGAYLRTKEHRLGHVRPAGVALSESNGHGAPPALDTNALVGEVRRHADRPHIVLKFAQTLDGRIATSTGDARWISGEDERRVSHALRAACDAVLVGVGTVIRDDPQLTVRMVPGVSPMRVVLDSTGRLPEAARILGPEAPTTVITTTKAPSSRLSRLRTRGVRVQVVDGGPNGVDLGAALRALHTNGIASVLVEGGARVITALLGEGLVDRLLVGVAPLIIGSGTEAVGALGVTRVADGIHLVNRSVHAVGDDLLLAWDVAH